MYNLFTTNPMVRLTVGPRSHCRKFIKEKTDILIFLFVSLNFFKSMLLLFPCNLLQDLKCDNYSLQKHCVSCEQCNNVNMHR